MVTDPMSIAKSRMMLRHTFFASLLVAMPLVALPDDHPFWCGRKPTACTDMQKIYYSASFMASLSKDVQLFVLGHEVMHPALKHGFRMRGCDPELRNIAQDFAINIMMRDAGFTIWKEAYLDMFMGKPVNFKGMSAEQIYPELLKMVKEGGGKGGGKGNQGGLGGDVREPNLSGEERMKVERQINQRVAQAAQAAAMCGQMKGDLAQMVAGILNPPLPWQDLLKDFATQFAPTDESWSHRNRRIQHTYMPGRRGYAMGEMVVAIDTSGSIRSDELAQAERELDEIAETVKPDRIRVVYCDVEVSGEEVFERGDELKIHPVGGGGTDMRVVLSYIERYDPIVAVLITDGFTPWGKEPPYPLVSILTTNAPCPVGRVIRMRA